MSFHFKLLVGLLVIAMMINPLSYFLIRAQFQINQSFIASVLCINRDKPQMHCNGHCFLKKEMNRQHERQDHHQQNTQQLSVFCREEPVIHQYFPPAYTPSLPVLSLPISKGFSKTNEQPPDFSPAFV